METRRFTIVVHVAPDQQEEWERRIETMALDLEGSTPQPLNVDFCCDTDHDFEPMVDED